MTTKTGKTDAHTSNDSPDSLEAVKADFLAASHEPDKEFEDYFKTHCAVAEIDERIKEREVTGAVGQMEITERDRALRELRAAREQLLAPLKAAEASSAMAPQPSPLPRSAAQDLAILTAIRDAGLDPQALPVPSPGTRGAKAAIRAKLEGVSPLFQPKSRTFDKAWERLRASSEIADKL